MTSTTRRRTRPRDVSEQAVLWAFGLLIGALFALVGFLGRIFWTKLAAVDTGALAQFVAKDAEREKAWWEWRASLDADRKARHDELARRLDSHASDIKDHGNRLTRLERNGYK